MTRKPHDASAWLKQAERLLRKKIDLLRIRAPAESKRTHARNPVKNFFVRLIPLLQKTMRACLQMLQRNRRLVSLAKRVQGKVKSLRQMIKERHDRLPEAAWGRFSEELARLLEGGVPLLEALAFLSNRGRQRQRDLSMKLSRDLREGQTLSESMRLAQAPLLVLALVQAGEHNGDLPGNLTRAAASCAQREAWRRERQQAMAYPAVLGVLLFCLIAFLFEVVVPRFADLYVGMGIPLGGATQLMFALARHDFLVLCAVFLIACLTFLTLRHVQERLPFLRQYHLLDRTHQWTVTLGVLIEGGLPLLQALEIQSNLALPPLSLSISQRTRTAILQGLPLSTALLHEPLDDTLILSVQVAEATGDLGRALLNTGVALATRRKQHMDLMLKLFEPVLLLIVGGVVGLVALFLFWPMLDLLQSI
ncbi:type II secretion system F family protein [Tumebacillus sp. ITR2]|uniref:Type II secretion system F family protein n=1 Tax=Tumebacillus amylolyticus TaxID=2801339 RepID=A0ABS1JA30_9BACL|nr:type II secretion system F family protein [Tumebacillus amylolyticus]MBL0387035.1 type II secretion system F family protein [Tumebacillus amylolyticus]